jgi:competence protein ComFC
MSFLDTILNIFFPIKCISCGSPGMDLCLKCISESPGAERESEEWIFPLFDYRHPSIKNAIWVLKYKGKKKLSGIFAEAMYGRILEELSDLSVMENFREPLLVPIPLSRKRRRERGYNQAELICEELMKLDNSVNFNLEKNVLIKINDRKHQAHIENRTERLKNIVGSFTVKNEERIKNRNIILIDDVTTTGATLKEARKILKSSGAKKIIAFTVAH